MTPADLSKSIGNEILKLYSIRENIDLHIGELEHCVDLLDAKIEAEKVPELPGSVPASHKPSSRL